MTMSHSYMEIKNKADSSDININLTLLYPF